MAIFGKDKIRNVALIGHGGEGKTSLLEAILFSTKAIEIYKKEIRPIVQQGDLYRLVSPYENTYASIMYVDQSKKKAVQFFYGLNMVYCGDYPPPVKLQGLDPKAKYRIEELNYLLDRKGQPKLHTVVNGEVLTGEALMEVGIGFAMRPEYDSAVLKLTRVE